MFNGSRHRDNNVKARRFGVLCYTAQLYFGLLYVLLSLLCVNSPHIC